MKTLVYTIVFITLLFNSVFAQNSDGFKIYPDLYSRFQNFSTQNGLSSNAVLGIVQDQYGIMWFATMDGLNRFDGYSFKVFKHELKNPNSLSDNFITCVETDVYGNLWVGTQNGLNKYNPDTNTFTRFFKSQHNQSISNNYIKALLADNAGYLWIDTKGTAMDRVDILKNQFVHIPHKNGEFEGDYYYHQIFKDSKSNIWMGGRTFHATKIPNSQPKKEVINIPIQTTSYQDVNTFTETTDHQIIGCTYIKTVAIFNPTKNLFENIPGLILPGNPCRSVTDHEGNIWVGGYNGLQCIDLKEKKMTAFFNQPMNEFSIPSNTVYYVYKDKMDNIWLGTKLGVSLYSKKWNQFRHYRQLFGNEYSLKSNSISALMQDKDGLMWIGLENDGVDTMSFSKERFGNIQYKILHQNISEKTFWKERDLLIDYFRTGLIKSKNKNQNLASIFQSYSSFKSASLNFSNANESEITSIYQDSKNNIYTSIYSNTGINQMDKKTGDIKRYSILGYHPNENFFIDNLGGNFPVQFLEDHKKRLWCVSWEGMGLNLFDRAQKQFSGKHFYNPNIPTGISKKTHYDPIHRRLWTNNNSLLLYYDLIKQKHHLLAPKLNSSVPDYKIHKDYYQYSKSEFIDYPMDFYINTFALDSEGNIWIGDKNSIIKIDGKSKKTETYFFQKKSEMGDHANIISMEVDSDKTLWFATEKNLFQMDIRTKKITKIPIKNVEKINIIYCINNQVWIGTQNGIWVYKALKNTYYKIPTTSFKNSQPISNITQIRSDNKGNIWLNANVGLIRLSHEKEIERYIFQNKEIPGTLIQSLYFDSKNQLWIGTNNGLALLNPISKTFKHFYSDSYNQFALLHNNVASIAGDKNGNIYINTVNGICQYEPRTEHFINLSQISDNTISSRLGSCMLQDYVDNIWYGTTDKGLNKIDAHTELITHYLHYDWQPNSIVSNNITCLWEDKKHRIWVGTDKGLDCFDVAKNAFIHYSIKNGLPDSYIMGITEDDSGNLWISTHKGLCVLHHDTQFFRQFFRFHGIADDEFTDAVCRLQNGQLAFGTYNGFFTFSPEIYTVPWESYKPILYDFNANNKVYWSNVKPNQKIKLKYANNSFIVSFSSIDYPFAKALKYRYQLKGFDKEWNYTENNIRLAKYTNLGWGNYTLQVEVSNPFGEFQGNIHQVFIHINTPWFASWWFILFSVGLLVFLIFQIIKYRERKLKEKNDLLENTVKERTSDLLLSNEKLTESEISLQKALDTKDKFFSIISHDLRNPSRSMKQMADMLYEQYEIMEPKQAGEFLKLLSETAKNNNQLIENLLYWSISQKQDFPAQPIVFNLQESVENVIAQIKSEADLKHISINNQIVENVDVFADQAMIETVLRNLMSNAIKYSYEKGNIMINAEDSNNTIKVQIIDFGIGLDADEVGKLFKLDSKLKKQGTKGEKGTGLGLILCAEFIKKNNGTIFAESVKNQKTIITFTLPKNT